MPPENGSSLDMWRAYHAKDTVDIAVIGSSLASCSLPEEELAADTGKSVALMATNSQSWDMSQIAMETVLREHTPERVILVMDLTNMVGEPYPKAQKAFLYAELQTAAPQDVPGELWRFVTSSTNFTNDRSLNAFFPWQSGSWPADWPAAIGQKTAAWQRSLTAAHSAPARTAHGQNDDDTVVVDFNTIGNANTWYWNGHDFTQEHIDELTSMLRMCRDKGVPLLVITAPRTTMDVISYETYFDDYNYFRDLCAQYGADYYDFNLAKPELFQSVEPDYYRDYAHMNSAGGKAFSQSMAKFLALLDAGQDVSGLFKTPEEYLAGVDYITNVFFTTELHDDKALLLATSYQGPSVQAEYQFLVMAPGDEEYTVFSDYSDRVWAECPLTAHGTYRFRVNARVIGSDTAYDRYYESTLEY